MKIHVLGAALLAFASPEVLAATLSNGDPLTITTGNVVFDANGNSDIPSGSYYGVDANGDGKIQSVEKIQLAQGTTGLVIGATSVPGASHSGCPTAGDTNAVTAPDCFLGNTGSWYFTIAPTGGTETGLNMSGWNWAWNGIPSIALGSRAWQPGNCADLGCSGYTFTDGIGRLQWDGVYGHAYTLDFTSTVAHNDPSGFSDVRFYTHLEGFTPMPVPEPAPAWMFGIGLLALAGMARARKLGRFA